MKSVVHYLPDAHPVKEHWCVCQQHQGHILVTPSAAFLVVSCFLLIFLPCSIPGATPELVLFGADGEEVRETQQHAQPWITHHTSSSGLVT